MSAEKRVKRTREADERRLRESSEWRRWKKEEKKKEEEEAAKKQKDEEEEGNAADSESSPHDFDQDGIFLVPDPLICKVDVGGPDWRSSTKWSRRRASSSNTSSASQNSNSRFGTHFSCPVGSDCRR